MNVFKNYVYQGLPIFVVVPWIIIRATIEDTLCWTTHDNPSVFLLIRIPIMISTFVSAIIFTQTRKLNLNKAADRHPSVFQNNLIDD